MSLSQGTPSARPQLAPVAGVRERAAALAATPGGDSAMTMPHGCDAPKANRRSSTTPGGDLQQLSRGDAVLDQLSVAGDNGLVKYFVVFPDSWRP